MGESSHAQHGDQRVTTRRWGLDSVESRSTGKRRSGYGASPGSIGIRRKLYRVNTRWDSGVQLGNLNRVGLR
jgi:hypothetical protein